MKPTLQTVADAVGVSRSTVSNAYSRPDQLSPKLRKKIFEAARQLGYTGPDPTARSLRSGRVGAIGVLLAPAVSYAFTDPYAVEFMRGLTESAERHEAGVLLLSLKDDDDAARAAVQSASVDGFCVYCVPGWYRALDEVWARGLPIVNASFEADDPDALFVSVDEAAAARAIGRHVVAFGHRRIALIGHYVRSDQTYGLVSVPNLEEVPSHVTRERFRGYREAFAEAGLAWSDVIIVNAAESTRREGATAAAQALDHKQRPTAIVAINDVLALGTFDALAARGLRPGRDVSVTGFDDIPDAAASQLTTVRQSATERGRIAAELVVNPPSDPAERHVVLPTELIVRASTGPVQEGNN